MGNISASSPVGWRNSAALLRVRLAVEANFRLMLKKFSSSVPCQSTGLRPGPGRGSSHMGYGAVVYG
jgi:hypothetical protein